MHFGNCLLFAALLLLAISVNSLRAQNRYQYMFQDPRLRRFESYNLDNYSRAEALLVPHPQAHNLQTVNYQRSNYRGFYNQQLPTSYQPKMASTYYQQQPRANVPTAELAKHRYEGNYIERIPGPIPAPALQQTHRRTSTYLPQAPITYANSVLQVEQSENADIADDIDFRHRRYTNTPRNYLHSADSLAAESIERKNLTQTVGHEPNETRYFHDIYMRYAGPHKLKHGHGELLPATRTRRYETQRGTQRYKGDV